MKCSQPRVHTCEVGSQWLCMGVSDWFQIGFRLISLSSGTSQMTDCCLLMCSQFGWENLHLVLIVPSKNPSSHSSLWSSVRQPERDADLGVESEIVQPGHSWASEQSRHMDRSGADGFWISLPQSWKSCCIVTHWATQIFPTLHCYFKIFGA